jgi:hypothetical protein
MQLREVGSYMAPGALYLEGYLEGGEEGRDKCARVLRALEAQGFADPRRGLAIHLPGAHLFD